MVSERFCFTCGNVAVRGSTCVGRFLRLDRRRSDIRWLVLTADDVVSYSSKSGSRMIATDAISHKERHEGRRQYRRERTRHSHLSSHSTACPHSGYEYIVRPSGPIASLPLSPNFSQVFRDEADRLDRLERCKTGVSEQCLEGAR